jgi:hypothetical protein
MKIFLITLATLIIVVTGTSSALGASAIAFNTKTEVCGYAGNYPTVAEAEIEALAQCPGGKIIKSGTGLGWWSIERYKNLDGNSGVSTSTCWSAEAKAIAAGKAAIKKGGDTFSSHVVAWHEVFTEDVDPRLQVLGSSVVSKTAQAPAPTFDPNQPSVESPQRTPPPETTRTANENVMEDNAAELEKGPLPTSIFSTEEFENELALNDLHNQTLLTESLELQVWQAKDRADRTRYILYNKSDYAVFVRVKYVCDGQTWEIVLSHHEPHFVRSDNLKILKVEHVPDEEDLTRYHTHTHEGEEMVLEYPHLTLWRMTDDVDHWRIYNKVDELLDVTYTVDGKKDDIGLAPTGGNLALDYFDIRGLTVKILSTKLLNIKARVQHLKNLSPSE